MEVNPYHLLQSADEVLLSKMKSSVEESLKNLTRQCFKVLHMVKRFREIYNNGKSMEEQLSKPKLDTWLMGFDNLNIKITRTFDDIKRHIFTIMVDQPSSSSHFNSRFEQFRDLQDEMASISFPSDPQHLFTLINQDKRALNSILHQMQRSDGKGHHVTSTNMSADVIDLRNSSRPAVEPHRMRDSSSAVVGPTRADVVHTSYDALVKNDAGVPDQQRFSGGSQVQFKLPAVIDQNPSSASRQPTIPAENPTSGVIPRPSGFSPEIISLVGIKDQFNGSEFSSYTLINRLYVLRLLPQHALHRTSLGPHRLHQAGHRGRRPRRLDAPQTQYENINTDAPKAILSLQVDPYKNVLVQDTDRTLVLFQYRKDEDFLQKDIHKATDKVNNIRLFGKFLVCNFKRDLYYHLLENRVYQLSGEEKRLQTTYQDKYNFEKIMDIEIEDLPAMNAVLYMTNKAGEIWAIKHPAGQAFKIYGGPAKDQEKPASQALSSAEYFFLRGGPEQQHLLVLVGYSAQTHSLVARLFTTSIVPAYTATSNKPGDLHPVKLEKLQDFEFPLQGSPGASKDKEELKQFYPQYVNMKNWYSTPTQTRYTNILVMFLMKYHSFFVILLQKNAMDQPYKFTSREERLPAAASTLKVSHGVAIPNNDKYQLFHSLILLFRNNTMLRLKIDFSKF